MASHRAKLTKKSLASLALNAYNLFFFLSVQSHSEVIRCISDFYLCLCLHSRATVMEQASVVLCTSNSLSSVRRHLVHFAKFPMLRFSKGCCGILLPHFSSNSTRIYRKHLIVGNIGYYFVWQSAKF